MKPSDTVMHNDPLNDPDESSGCGGRCGHVTCTTRCWLRALKSNLLVLLLILALVLGIVLGVMIRAWRDEPFTDRQLMYFRFPGDLLMRMLKALIIPLIVSSLISGLAGLDAKSCGKMGLRAVVYYFATTIVAVILGIILVMSIKPGDKSDVVDDDAEADEGNIADSFLDLIRNMFPDNVVEAAFRQTKTYQVKVEEELENYTRFDEKLNMTTNISVHYDPSIRKEYGMNVLGLVVYSVAMGVVVSQMGELGKPIYDFTYSLAEATMKLVVVVIWYSPIGVMFLVAAEILDMGDPVKELEMLALYIATVMAGLAIHGLIILPLFYFIVVRKNPYPYLINCLQALFTALGTASSSATLPVTYKCLEEKNYIDRRVTRFVLPVGATINMDGTALYEAVAALFIAQLNGLNLNAADIVATSITATLASIGAASVPQAGLVTMIIVLSALNLPADQVTRILAVDWLLDRFRTMVNVEGDSIGAGIVAHLSRKELEETHEDAQEPSHIGADYHPDHEHPKLSHGHPDLDSNGYANKAYVLGHEDSTGF